MGHMKPLSIVTFYMVILLLLRMVKSYDAKCEDMTISAEKNLHVMSMLSGRPERKVISMSLYGDRDFYVVGAIRNAELAPIHFPGWTLRIYVEAASNHSVYGRVPADALARLEALGADLRYVDPAHTSLPPMMWRFLVAADLSVDRFIVRDADSRLSARDAAAVQAWIQSGQPFHCVRDHPYHVYDAVGGGLWGAKPSGLLQLVPTFCDLMKGFGHAYSQDMKFLNERVWPLVKQHAYCSDSVSCEVYESSHPFPVARIGYEHIGQVYDENEVVKRIHVLILQRKGENIHCVPPADLSGHDANGTTKGTVPQNIQQVTDPATVRLVTYQYSAHSDDVWLFEPASSRYSRYAVFGATVPRGPEDSYSFYLPLTVRAWRRIGYGSVVYMVGDRDKWLGSPQQELVLNEVLSLGGVFVFIHSPDRHAVMLSQVCRLFISAMVQWDASWDAFILTTDADLWPLNQNFYQKNSTAEILLLNSKDKLLTHRNKRYTHFNLCNMGMSVKSWRDVMRLEAATITIRDLIAHVSKEFDEDIVENVRKGHNRGWYLDQILASVRIAQWAEMHGWERVQRVRRNTAQDRIDRRNWRVGTSLDGVHDTHLPLKFWQTVTWEKLLQLLKLMYTEQEVRACTRYRDKFLLLG